MHKWDQTGIKDIEGYASYIEKSSKLIKVMRTTGYVGVGLDFASYTTNVYDACAKGRENECRKAAIVEYSKFGGKQTASALGGAAGGIIARSTCMWVMGLITSAAGGVGAGLCLVAGIGSSIVGSKIAEKYGETMGESLGEAINNKVARSDDLIHDPDTNNEKADRLIYEQVFNGKL